MHLNFIVMMDGIGYYDYLMNIVSMGGFEFIKVRE